MDAIFSQLPTPIEILLDPLSLIILGIYLCLILLGSIFSSKKTPFGKILETPRL